MPVCGLAFALASGCAAPGNDTGSSPDQEVAAGGAPEPSSIPGIPALGIPVLPGIDVLLRDSLHLVSGRRVGLITNHTGIDAQVVSSIDRLARQPGVELVALFSPEHGIRGTAQAGAEVGEERDPGTGLVVHSLYGATLKPTPAMLRGVEVLLFDIQDIGARYYTYVYTMALAMEAAGEQGIPFVVLDRPNPVGGLAVQGNILDPAFASFVGRYPIPMRHGMTPGELARLFQSEFGVQVDLTVVPVDGWRRSMLFPETGLPWRPPSPNMPSLESALHYPGTCLFEGTNLSVGRGTERPFQRIGAPWLDGEELTRRMSARGIPGVAFHAEVFTPTAPGDGKFDGVELRGVRLEVTDPALYDPTRTAVALLVEARRLSGDAWRWNADQFDRLAGTDRLRFGVEEGRDVPELADGWTEALDAFEGLRRASLLYAP
ncbi:MAG: DUF1343 domain-containing protein [Gemmatimonadetes bacterium]|nr:DUF1343 domain-containing protein [Gemmatimonadota bacterium]